MIRKSLIALFAFCVVYHVGVYFFGDELAPRQPWVFQNQWHANDLRAEDYLFEKNDDYNIILSGSSLTSRLIDDKMPGIYKLSFSGRAAVDSLNVVLQKDILPSWVLIESNDVTKEEDVEFREKISNPAVRFVKTVFPFLRDRYQPIAVLGYPVAKLFHVPIAEKSLTLSEITERLRSRTVNEQLIRKRLQRQQKPLSEEEFLAKTATLRNLVRELESKGVRVGFYEMPVYAEIRNAQRSVAQRAMIKKIFPPERYLHIEPDPAFDPKPRDGTHLSLDESVYFTAFLFDRIIEYTQEKSLVSGQKSDGN
jgi:hypothetical protein